jgi:hypothetical protein
MPASRPRMLSAMGPAPDRAPEDPEVMSSSAESTRKTATSQMLGIRPATSTQAPYAAAATTIARPWWWTREVQPLSAVTPGRR